jgi:hypothetical protein
VKVYDRHSTGTAAVLELERAESIRAVALDGHELAIGGDANVIEFLDLSCTRNRIVHGHSRGPR